MAITHINSILRRHHIPQSITAKDDVAMSFGIEGHHHGIRLWRNHKLTTVEVITPQIAWDIFLEVYLKEQKYIRTLQYHFMDTNVANRVFIFTKGSCHSQEGDLINDCTSPHRTVMGQPGTFPHNTVHPRFLHYTTLRRIAIK